MYCNCRPRHCYPHRHCLEAESASLAQGVSATITMAPDTYVNRDCYDYKYCVHFSGALGTEALSISNGTTSYPVWDKDGEPVKIGRLRRGANLSLKFISTAPAHFTLLNCLPCLCIKTPEVVAAPE